MMKAYTIAAFLAFSIASSALAQSAPDDAKEKAERGRYIAVLGDCVACHTVRGGKPFVGGVALETPFGKLVGPNITPDKETGIGTWAEADFKRMMHEGRGKDGIHLYPAMPYPSYTKVTEEDVSALWTYFQTIEPIRNEVQANQLPFPFNIRFANVGWNLINFEKGEYRANPAKSASWNRGAYLVEGLGHCGTCHTPKNLLFGDKNSKALEGGTLENWYAPDISPNAHKGIGGWSLDELVQYLKTGANTFAIASGPMAEVVDYSTSHMTEPDLLSIATYLKDSRPADKEDRANVAASDPRMAAGKAIYEDRCSACHVSSGQGAPGLFPRLAGAPAVNSTNATTLIRVVLAGNRGIGTKAAPTAPAMPAYAWNLNDEDVANVLTYIRNSWGNAAKAVSASDVGKLRAALGPAGMASGSGDSIPSEKVSSRKAL